MRVPVYNPQARSTALPGVRQQGSIPVVPVGGEQARQTQMLGAAMTKTGGALADIQIDRQQEVNQLRVDDAINKAMELAQRYTFDPEIGYTHIKGEAALNRQGGAPLSEEYTALLGKELRSISDKLGNDAQRAAFRRYQSDLTNRFQGQLMAHEGEEYRTYRASVREGTIANRTNAIALAYNDPTVVTENIQSINAAVWDLGRLNGWGAEKVQAQQRDATSVAHRTALAAAIQNGDLGYADKYLKKYSSEMSAVDILRVDGLISGGLDARLGAAAADTAINEALPRFMPSDLDRAFNIALGTESNHQQFDAAGQPLTSSAGAIGIAQVMPGTAPEAAKLAGLDWDETKYRTDAEYNKALGKAYFEEQLRKNGGSLTKAYAAYNAGPGRLKEAIAKHGDNWMAGMPEETRNYVAKNMREFAAGKGAPTPPTRAELMGKVRDLVGTDNPERLRLALDDADRKFTLVEAEVKTRGEQATARAMRELLSNGGNFSGLSAAARGAIPADKVSTVMDFAKRVAQGDDVTNPAVYLNLSDPTALASMSDDVFFALRGELSEADWKMFAKQRDGKAAAKDKLNTAAISRVLNHRLASLGMDTTPKEGTNSAARLGAIRSFVDRTILEEQAISGKEMTDADVENHIDKLMMTTSEVSEWFGVLKSNQRILTQKADNIPSNVKKALRADFKRMGVDLPSDTDLLGAYLHFQYQSQRTAAELQRLNAEAAASGEW